MVGFTQFHLSVVLGGAAAMEVPTSRRVRVRRGDRGIGPFLLRKALGQESIE